MLLRLEGLLLFVLTMALPLCLLLAQPIEPLASLFCGVLLLLCGRFLAAPHLARNREKRCIWSGAEIAPGCDLGVRASGAEYVFHTYHEPERERAARFFALAERCFWPLRAAILGPLACYAVAEALRLLDAPGAPRRETSLLVLEGVAGLACLAALAALPFVPPPARGARASLRFPFPAHSVSLLGVLPALVVVGAAAACGAAAAALEVSRRLLS
ncbi:MAG: hypothetical protein HY812_02910 [Planctomycetes bacterium]|nr:hypothetical protein [Planctomycetota bacterium]